jgi:hypothetical protein
VQKPHEPKPPNEPPNSADARRGLDEVERALSVLDGRHPEHRRAQRETIAAAEERRKTAEHEAKAARKRARRTGVLLAAGAIAAVTVAAIVVGLVRRSSKIAEALTSASAPWEARGFGVVASSGFWSGPKIDAMVDAGCIVVVGTSDAAIVVERGASRGEGRGSIGWCACERERVVATTTLAPGALGGVRVLRVEADAVGGAKLFASHEPHPQTMVPGGAECAEASFDAWIATHAPVAPASDRIEGARASLASEGFRAVASGIAGAAFVVFALPDATCAIAESTANEDAIALRTTGGARVVASRGAIGWCGAHGATYSVWRDGGGDVRIIAAPSSRVGGVLGLREAAARAGIASLATWTRSDDHAADAADTLRASALPNVAVSPDATAPATGAQDKRIVALVREPGAVVEITPPAGGYHLCLPPLDADVTHALCIESSPHAWRAKDGTKVGLAYAPLPFWLAPFATIHEPDALSGVLALLGVARRLGASAFAPTILGNATETPKGVDVLGRAGEDAIVAVGIQPKAPWLLAYTNGPRWDLAGEPLVLPLKPFEHASLSLAPAPSMPKEARRTVVFRHATNAKP